MRFLIIWYSQKYSMKEYEALAHISICGGFPGTASTAQFIVSAFEIVSLRVRSHLATVATMSRQYNSDLDAVGYHRRHGRNIPADGLYRSRESSRTHPIGSRPIQSSSAVESESERGQNRRRIAVAVRFGSISYKWMLRVLVTNTHQ